MLDYRNYPKNEKEEKEAEVRKTKERAKSIRAAIDKDKRMRKERETAEKLSRKKENPRQAFEDWLATPRADRVPKTKTALAQQLGCSVGSFRNWEKELDDYDSKTYFLSRRKQIDKAAADACIARPNSQMFTAIKKVSGELVEKQEVTHRGLSADDIDRLKKQAKDGVRDFLSGIREVPSESDILSN